VGIFSCKIRWPIRVMRVIMLRVLNIFRRWCWVILIWMEFGLTLCVGHPILLMLRGRRAIPPVHLPGMAEGGEGKASCIILMLVIVVNFLRSYFDGVGNVHACLHHGIVRIRHEFSQTGFKM
jgi:hypothetical protein